MSCRIGLSIGDSFAELRARLGPQAQADTLVQTRWYFGRKNLSDGLFETLQKIETEHGAEVLNQGLLRIGTSRTERAIERRQGNHPAVLISSGFENHLKLSEQKTIPLDTGLIFSVTGRVARDGQITSPLKVEELELLAAKLELLKIRTVSLLFINSALNPEPEATARNFFVEKGYRVVGAADVDATLSESARWNQIIELGYAESAIDELRKQINEALDKALGEKKSNWEIEFWGEEGLTEWSKLNAAKARGGLHFATLDSQRLAPSTSFLHLGLEMFQLLTSDKDSKISSQILPFRPTHRIGLGDWPFPTLTQEDVGFEPGPMLLGKSHQLTFLDLLFTQGKLQEIEGLTPLISERSRARILESILTLGRAIPREDTSSPIDSRAVAQDLETACLEKISGTLSLHGVRGKITLSGVFAETFLPLLKQRRSDLTFTIDKDASWTESEACGKFNS